MQEKETTYKGGILAFVLIACVSVSLSDFKNEATTWDLVCFASYAGRACVLMALSR